MADENKSYHPSQVKNALHKLSLTGVKFRQICLKLNDGERYYFRLHGRLKNDIPIPYLFLKPVLDKLPELLTLIEAEPEFEKEAENPKSKDLDSKLGEMMAEMKTKMELMQKRLDEIGEGQKWQAEYIELLKKMAGVDIPKKD